MNKRGRGRRRNESFLEMLSIEIESFLERLGTVGIVIFLVSIGFIFIILWLIVVNPFSIAK